MVLWSGEQEKHGVGFILEKRVTSVRLASNPFNTTIIQVYAPRNDYGDQVIDGFCEEIEEITWKMPKNNLLIVLGDWNAQIREGTNHNLAGKFGYGVTNERGMKLLEFAERQKMPVALLS